MDLSDEDIEDRFFLLGRMEILSALNDLIHRREGISVSFNGGRDGFLTTLLEARPEALIFDCSSDEESNKRLQRSPSCIFVARPDGIRTQFSGTEPKRFTWGGSAAFWVPLPARLIRLQRRESYRIAAPVAKGLAARLFDETGARIGEWRVHDLSVGGFAANVEHDPQLEIGQPLARVAIALPHYDAVDCAARVRHVTAMGERDGKPRFRVGIAFVSLSRSSEVDIQRFVIDIEHERRALLMP